MQNIFKSKSWSPYAAGAGIGVLTWITFLLMGHKLGVSTVFVNIAAFIEKIFVPIHFQKSAYFLQAGGTLIDWQFAFVLFTFVGSLVSSYLGKTRMKQAVPSVWKKRFGSSKNIRNFWAFIGGILLIIGARIAGGCTSEHGISGGLQLAVTSWIFVAVLFSTGILVALLIYRD
ncbi:YeeE/YedE family protein [Candidatus Babeliales bacterium]|nr:YeeE/YedE family protein [Candidatus Babeliales bacterium]